MLELVNILHDSELSQSCFWDVPAHKTHSTQQQAIYLSTVNSCHAKKREENDGKKKKLTTYISSNQKKKITK